MNMLKIKLDEHDEIAVRLVASALGIRPSKLKIDDMPFVSALSAYNRAHAECLKIGTVTANRFGELRESVQSKNRRKALKWLNAEFKKRGL